MELQFTYVGHVINAYSARTDEGYIGIATVPIGDDPEDAERFLAGPLRSGASALDEVVSKAKDAVLRRTLSLLTCGGTA